MSNVFKVEGTSETPMVSIHQDTQAVEISGVCMPENAFEFFTPVHEMIASTFAEDLGQAKVVVSLLYLNSTANKHVLRILKTIEDAGVAAEVEWHFAYGDDLMRMKGEELRDICPKLNFEFIEDDDDDDDDE